MGVSLVGVVNDSGEEVGGSWEEVEVECWDEVRAVENRRRSYTHAVEPL